MADDWKCEDNDGFMFLTAKLHLRSEFLCYCAGQHISVLRVYMHMHESCM